LHEFSGDLLIAAPSRWDEACFAAPAVRSFAASGWAVGLICCDAQEGFWKTIPGIRIRGVTPKESARPLAGQLRGHWRAALAWEDGIFAKAIRKSAIPRTMAPGGERWARWASEGLDLKQKPKAHRVEYYLASARALGRETGDARLFSPIDWQDPVKENPLLLVPDSDFGPSHEWPLESWKKLSTRLFGANLSFRVGVMENGRGLGKMLAEHVEASRPVPLEAAASALPQLAGFQSLIAADGSLPHLAAHVGVRCLTLFGPNDPHWRRPLGRMHRTVRQHVECAPCLLSRCPLDRRCQTELGPEKVWHEYHQMLVD